MDFPILQPQLMVGLEKDIKGNVQYLSNDEIVYPVGTVLTVHNVAQKKQRYIRLTEKGKNLSAINVSPNGEIIAVAEASEKSPIITLWDPILFKKKKTINLPPEKDIQSSEFACFQFSFDSKYIVAITGAPDWTLYNIKIEKGRIESSARANNLNGSGTVEQVACNPNDINQICLCGDQVLRHVGCVDLIWRQFGYNKLDHAYYTTCAWLSQDRSIVGSSRGKIIIFDTGEIRAIFHASDMPIINLKVKDEEENLLTSHPSYYDSFGLDLPGSMEDYGIRGLVVFNRGFAFGYTNGKVHLYEKETSMRYTRRGIFIIPDRSINRDYEEEPEAITTVNNITINPLGDRLLVSCNEMQLWTEKLWIHDAMTGIAVDMKPFGYDQHLGPIAGIAVCRWKPIALTIGAEDRSAKLWNYETSEIQLAQQFEDDVYSVDLHPTGLYAILGFSDKLRFMTIMIDEIITTREFNIRGCTRCSFSRLGHLFAGSNVNVIQIFSTVTFELMFVLKGHNGHISGLDWSENDSVLATCGLEGAVYLWDVAKSTRINETVIKSNPAKVVRVFKDGKGCYSVGMDGHIREFVNAEVQRDVPMPVTKPIDVLILSALDNMMFVAGNDGTIFIVQLPLLEKAEYVEFNMHKTSVLQAVLSYDDKYLISGSVDGVVVFWKLINAEEKAIQKFDFVSTNEILISKFILDDKLEQIRNLQLRMNELENEHNYQMKQNDAMAASKLRDIHEGYCNAIEELKLKNEQMEGEHIQEINNINNQISKMKQTHVDFVENMESNYNEKLIAEYEKYIKLEHKLDSMLKDADTQYKALEEAKRESEMALIDDFTRQLAEKEQSYNELMVAHQIQARDHEIIKQQIEDDADREIYELKENHMLDLKEEQDINMRLRSDISSMKKKYILAQRDVDEYKQKVFNMEGEHVKFKGFIMSLEQDITDMKKEIQERDQTIEEKEKRIYSLKGRNQELEKFKFILDFKIKELKSQIEPKERTITEQTTQINQMVRELENLQKVILGLDLQLEEFREKLNAANNEVKKELNKNRRMKKALQDIRIDIHQASGLIQNIPLLQRAVRNMYHKYNADKDFEVAQQEDTEAKSEFLRQRDFLERAVSTLHYQATKNTNLLSYDKVRLVDENAALLEETNILRKNLQSEVVQNRKLNSLVGMSRMSPQQAQQRVDFATDTNKEIHKQYKDSLEQNTKTLSAMQNENMRLLNKITEMDSIEKDKKGGT